MDQLLARAPALLCCVCRAMIQCKFAPAQSGNISDRKQDIAHQFMSATDDVCH